MNNSEEKIKLKRRYVECLERSEKPSTTTNIILEPTSPDPIDVDIDGFNSMVKLHLKSLSSIARLKVQQDILKIIYDAKIKEA